MYMIYLYSWIEWQELDILYSEFHCSKDGWLDMEYQLCLVLELDQ